MTRRSSGCPTGMASTMSAMPRPMTTELSRGTRFCSLANRINALDFANRHLRSRPTKIGPHLPAFFACGPKLLCSWLCSSNRVRLARRSGAARVGERDAVAARGNLHPVLPDGVGPDAQGLIEYPLLSDSGD